MAKHAIIAAFVTLLLFNSGLFMFAVPVPIFYLYSVYHRKTGLIGISISLAAGILSIAFKMAVIYDVCYLAYFLCIGAIMGECVAGKKDILKLSIAAIFVPWIFLMAAFIVTQFLLGIDIAGQLREYFLGTLTNALEVQKTFTSMPPVQLAYLKENAPFIADFALKTLPSTLLIFTLVVVSLTFFLGRMFTKKFGSLKYFGNVAVMHFPFWPVWLMIVCGAAFFANVYLVGNAIVKFAAINGLIFCAGVFFLEGCFVLSFWLNKGRSPFLRLLVYGAIIIFVQVVGFFIIALGLSDQWFDYRKRQLKHNTV